MSSNILFSLICTHKSSSNLLTTPFIQTQSGKEAFCTTSTDLAGFWDMVMLQIDDVGHMFMEIDTLKKNGWKSPVITRAKHKVCISSVGRGII